MYIYKGIGLVIFVILQIALAKKVEKPTPGDIVTEEGTKYCENATGVTESQASAFLVKENNTIITQEIKCYWECFFKKIGWMDENGDFNDKPVNLSPQPCYVKYGFPCLNATGVDTCDKAVNFLKCFDEIFTKETYELGGRCDDDDDDDDDDDE